MSSVQVHECGIQECGICLQKSIVHRCEQCRAIYYCFSSCYRKHKKFQMKMCSDLENVWDSLLSREWSVDRISALPLTMDAVDFEKIRDSVGPMNYNLDFEEDFVDFGITSILEHIAFNLFNFGVAGNGSKLALDLSCRVSLHLLKNRIDLKVDDNVIRCLMGKLSVMFIALDLKELAYMALLTNIEIDEGAKLARLPEFVPTVESFRKHLQEDVVPWGNKGFLNQSGTFLQFLMLKFGLLKVSFVFESSNFEKY